MASIDGWNNDGQPCPLCKRTEWHRQGSLKCEQTELALLRAQVQKLETELTEVLCFAPRCKQCGKACEPQRWVYVVPTCYACLPPPEPIETDPAAFQRKTGPAT